MTLKAAELCAGYGGLALAIEEVFGAETAWVSEFEAAPSKILAHHWPTAPNHGDMTKINWSAVEPVDIISGGTPCQDLSGAGKRRGMTEGTRSNLWVQMREAVATIRPTYVIWENVRGAYSAEASSDLEHCPGCMGASSDPRIVLRALGRVLGDLSDLGYDCQWRGLRAADVGAAHGRFRVFVLATYTGRSRRSEAFEHDGRSQAGGNRAVVPNESDRHALRLGPIGEDVANTSGNTGRLGHGNDVQVRGATLGHWQGARRSALAHPNDIRGNRSGEWAEQDRRGQPANSDSDVVWGEYEPAIRRWEAALGRCAPAPTEPTGRNGGHQLSARFAEWMMGVPDGWIVDVPGITRNEALKAAGNGVVPAQAAAAIRDMLAASVEIEVAA